MKIQTFARGTLAAVLLALAACGGQSNDAASTADVAAHSGGVVASHSGAAMVSLSAAQYNVPASRSSAVVTVYRAGNSTGSATVNYATANGTATAGADYSPTQGSLSWTDGDTSPRSIVVPIKSTGASKHFTVQLVSASGSAALGSPAAAQVNLDSGSSSSSSSGGSSSSSSGSTSTSSSSSSGSGGTSSGGNGTSSSSSGNANVSAATAAVLAYFNSLSSGSGKHILSGQHSSYWSSNPLDNQQAAASQTGKNVAILGTTSGQEGSTEDTVSLTNQWLAKGGIPLVSWWPVDPFTGQCDNDRNIDFSQLTQPGTAAYIAWYKLLDQQIAMFKQINGPVLYRPLLEMNGNWSWWGDQPPAEMVKVWQQMHDYFVSKGVTNVLWVFNVNSWTGNYTQYYPGAGYVDIVSWDAYPPTVGDPAYAALVSLNKPLILAETGVESSNNGAVAPFSGDNGQLLASVKANFPKVVAIVLFCQNWALNEQNGAATFMNDSAVVSMGDLPSGLVDP